MSGMSTRRLSVLYAHKGCLSNNNFLVVLSSDQSMVIMRKMTSMQEKWTRNTTWLSLLYYTLSFESTETGAMR